LASWFLLLVPLTLLLVGLRRPGKLSFDEHGLLVLKAFPVVTVIGVAVFVVQCVAAALGVVLLAILATFTEDSAPLVGGSVLVVGSVLLGIVWFALSGLRDLGYAATVTADGKPKRALALTLAALRHRTRAALPHYGAFLLACAVLVGTTALLLDVLDVSKPGAYRVVLAVLVHQLTLFGLVVLRASWLASALEVVSSWSPAPDDTRARSDEKDAPNPNHDASFDAPTPDNARN
jgi:hypothetical protein